MHTPRPASFGLAALFALAMTACTAAPSRSLAGDRDQELPAKQAIRLLLRNANTPLSVDPSCAGVGTDTEDATLGDYLAGFLAELTEGANTIDAICLATESPDRLDCRVLVKHSLGEDEWAWGVGFAARGERIVPGSVRCLGAG